MEGIEVRADGLDGTEGLREGGAGFEDVVLGGFTGAGSTVCGM